VPQISQVTSSIPAIGCEIATITAKIAPVAPQLSLVAVPDIMPNFSLVTPQLAAIASDLSRILSKLATIDPRSIVVSAPPYDGMCGGRLGRGVGSSDHQSSGKESGCAQFRHLNSPALVCPAARSCAASTR